MNVKIIKYTQNVQSCRDFTFIIAQCIPVNLIAICQEKLLVQQDCQINHSYMDSNEFSSKNDVIPSTIIFL